jgi:hypothetical protein
MGLDQLGGDGGRGIAGLQGLGLKDDDGPVLSFSLARGGREVQTRWGKII